MIPFDASLALREGFLMRLDVWEGSWVEVWVDVWATALTAFLPALALFLTSRLRLRDRFLVLIRIISKSLSCDISIGYNAAVRVNRQQVACYLDISAGYIYWL